MLVWRLPASDQITECTKGKGTAMKQQFLHENWEMRQIGNDEFLPAAVPGSVYGDLLSNGKMENPFWKDNENDACELMEEDFKPRRQDKNTALLKQLGALLCRYPAGKEKTGFF